MLPRIEFEGNWIFSEENLLETVNKYDAVYLTVESSLKILDSGFVEGIPNLLAGGKTYTNGKQSFEVVDAVSDGRKVAMAIHHLFEER